MTVPPWVLLDREFVVYNECWAIPEREIPDLLCTQPFLETIESTHDPVLIPRLGPGNICAMVATRRSSTRYGRVLGMRRVMMGSGHGVVEGLRQ